MRFFHPEFYRTGGKNDKVFFYPELCRMGGKNGKMVKKIINSKKIVFGLPIFLFTLDIVFMFTLSEDVFSNWVLSASMHFLGGLSMAVIFFHFFGMNKELYSFQKNVFVTIILAVGFAVLIGVLWEFSEFCLGFTLLLEDTLADLFFDLLGGLFFALFYLKSALYLEQRE